MKLFIGLMSGTSMDGVDAALINAETNTLIDGTTRPYGEHALRALNEVLAGRQDFKTCNRLNVLLGQEFAEAALCLLNKNGVNPADIMAIGSHGQTLCHDTRGDVPYTVQSGCAHTIAELTGIQVVADFRTRDIVLGGQGAPFAPIYHQTLFRDLEHPLAIVNIGGIANVTFLGHDGDVSGFDTGPGNCLMDAWIYQQKGKHYDDKGIWAGSGEVIEELLLLLLNDPFFRQTCPKSIGKEYFSLPWLKKKITAAEYEPQDIQATLLHVTAATIAQSIIAQQITPKQVLVCGGGAHNCQLLQVIQSFILDIPVRSTEVFNINPDFIEAQMFAWLAEKTLTNEPVNLLSVTGARKKAVLGVIYPAGIDK
ncbi:anhydro-N-acetylmuramic acid kinase [Legionella spiritensis]|uniref:Anhydro-N-acetylmuramic acid kinase n=1 Tax=Legionella spiritensis TaxID=452 RepID=A0A0W0Z4F3_LEGSP|nr:anhydro-N-acetylmuramic acid kinase [Legionella spiritensis]KTD64032.1 anhydro-N-acetylmuramic acid kinase [Legionella spiritensis]SNV37305.1 anhydro-N-acetylmuramic acid kinase [Legionella spiritensis]